VKAVAHERVRARIVALDRRGPRHAGAGIEVRAPVLEAADELEPPVRDERLAIRRVAGLACERAESAAELR
jgi:hypothetical protein